jgi:hypothetical protein
VGIPDADIRDPFPTGLVAAQRERTNTIGLGFGVFNPKRPFPYVWQYGFEIQRQLPWDMLCSTGAVGSGGRDIPVAQSINDTTWNLTNRIDNGSDGCDGFFRINPPRSVASVKSAVYLAAAIDHGSNGCNRLMRIDPSRSVASVKSAVYLICNLPGRVNEVSAANLAQGAAFLRAQVPNPFAGRAPGTGLNGAPSKLAYH